MGAQSFGKFPSISGKAGSFPSTLVPIHKLADLKSANPIPITSTAAGVFTVAGSKTRPVNLWNGNDFVQLKEGLAYTWTSATNNILSSTAAAATNTGATAGIWYYYVGLSDTNTVVIKPSQTEPKFVEGPFQNGMFTHPGTARTQYWNYVGFATCTTAASATFILHEKTGFTYNFASQSVATATTWAELDTSLFVPKHGPIGATVGGWLETGAVGTVTVGNTSTEDRGRQIAKWTGTTTPTALLYTPFNGIHPTANGKVWGNHDTAAGDVHISQVTDVV